MRSARVAAGLRGVAERIHPAVALGLETHGDFAAAEETAAIVRLVDHPAAGIVWDAANTTSAGEATEAAARAVRRCLASDAPLSVPAAGYVACPPLHTCGRRLPC